MRSDSDSSKLCVVAYDRGLVSAAVYENRKGIVSRHRLWLRGARPAWVRSASRNMPTLVVDYEAPTLANSIAKGENPQEKLARMGVGENSLIARMSGYTVAMRADRVDETVSAALDTGLVCDAVTSLPAVELATFLHPQTTGDCARLTCHAGAAILTIRESGRISVRRFALPASTEELDAAIRLCTVGLLSIDGLLEMDARPIAHRDGLTLRDTRVADADTVAAEVLERAAKLFFARELATFVRPGMKARNSAYRWLPPCVLSLAILTLAALFPLASSFRETALRKETLEKTQVLLTEAESRAAANRPTLARIERLSTDYNRILDSMTLTRRTIDTIGKIQGARKAARHLEIETISIEKGGRRMTLTGSLPSRASDELTAFTDKLAKARYRQASDLALREDSGGIHFSMMMEALK